MANLDQIMDHLADNTIVETGTDGDWSYRKWSDGTAEAWGIIHLPTTSYAFTTSQQSGKYYTNSSWTSYNVNLPSGLFNSDTTVTASISNNGYLVYGVVGASATGLNFTMRAFSLYSQTYTISSIFAYAIGRWK